MTQSVLFENQQPFSSVRLFFEQMTPEKRQSWKKQYEEGLADKKTMPWMHQAWSEGLALLNQVIKEKDEPAA